MPWFWWDGEEPPGLCAKRRTSEERAKGERRAPRVDVGRSGGRDCAHPFGGLGGGGRDCLPSVAVRLRVWCRAVCPPPLSPTCSVRCSVRIPFGARPVPRPCARSGIVSGVPRPAPSLSVLSHDRKRPTYIYIYKRKRSVRLFPTYSPLPLLTFFPHGFS